MIAKSMKPFLAGSSVIRAMFEEGKKMAKVYGPENVYDFSVGNPGLNPPQEVFDAIDYINHEMDPHEVHSYPSNAGYESTRKAVADDLNERFGSNFTADNIIMTVGAGSAINILLYVETKPFIILYSPSLFTVGLGNNLPHCLQNTSCFSET